MMLVWTLHSTQLLLSQIPKHILKTLSFFSCPTHHHLTQTVIVGKKNGKQASVRTEPSRLIHLGI